MKLVIKKARDLSKLVPEEITDKNGVHRTVYVSPEMPTEQSKHDTQEDTTDQIAARVEAIKRIVPQECIPETGIDKKQAEDIFASFDGTKNCMGEKTRFPRSTVGKILRNKGFDTSLIIRHFGELYHTALFAYNEKEREQTTRPDGTEHKKHPNFIGYHNFVNKFKVNDREYYIRFTVQEEVKPHKNSTLPNHVLHSSFVSDVSIYDQARGTLSGRSPAVTSSQTADKRLLEFFNAVNKDNPANQVGGSVGGNPDYPVKVKKSLAGCGHKRQKMIKVMLVKMIRNKL